MWDAFVPCCQYIVQSQLSDQSSNPDPQMPVGGSPPIVWISSFSPINELSIAPGAARMAEFIWAPSKAGRRRRKRRHPLYVQEKFPCWSDIDGKHGIPARPLRRQQHAT